MISSSLDSSTNENAMYADIPKEITECVEDLNIQLQAASGQRFRNFDFLPSSTAYLIYGICHDFEISEQIEFTCYDNCQRFFENHYNILENKILAAVAESSSIPEKANVSRDMLEQEIRSMSDLNVEKQLLLRILSVMKISVKFVDWRKQKQVTFKKMYEYLMECGHRFSLKSIKNSEMRVFQTMDFKVESPITYCFVYQWIPLLFESFIFGRVNDLCVRLLRLVYLNRQKISDGCQLATHNLTSDQLTLSAGVIFTAVRLLEHLDKKLILKATYFFENVVKLNVADIHMLADALIKITLGENEEVELDEKLVAFK